MYTLFLNGHDFMQLNLLSNWNKQFWERQFCGKHNRPKNFNFYSHFCQKKVIFGDIIRCLLVVLPCPFYYIIEHLSFFVQKKVNFILSVSSWMSFTSESILSNIMLSKRYNFLFCEHQVFNYSLAVSSSPPHKPMRIVTQEHLYSDLYVTTGNSNNAK